MHSEGRGAFDWEMTVESGRCKAGGWSRGERPCK
jgi:hypothetical protein